MRRHVIEGKTTRDENFPVASLLLPPALRGPVEVIYRFARSADDFAAERYDIVVDFSRFRPGDRLYFVNTLAHQDGKAPEAPAEHAAARLVDHLGQRGVSALYARHLLQAFTRDALNDPTRSWSDLMAYCRFSAAPVGRFLIDVHGESKDAYPASDALCASLQVLNHLQDIKDDARLRQRVYLPEQWRRIAPARPCVG